MLWYQEKIEDVYQVLQSHENGINQPEAEKRLREFGPNQLALKSDPWWKVVVEPFRNIFVAVLSAAAFLSILSHEYLDAVIILTIVTINAIIFYTQHYATSRVLRSLKKHSQQFVTALRDNEEVRLASADLVPGDVIVLSEGERIPADCRLIHVSELQVDESALTGESIPVHKHPGVLTHQKAVFEQANMVFQGTYVVSGSCRAIVVETGGRTEFGRIADLASDAKQRSPVQDKIDHLITLLIKIIGTVSVFVFFLALARGIPASEAIRFVLSMTVAAVPEGLPVALTVIIVLGMRRMATHKALVRSFKAIEDIGLLTVIATDKTGTLTKNKLEIADAWAPHSTADDLRAVAIKTVNVTTTITDPLDQAIIGKPIEPQANSDVTYYPFQLALRRSGSYHPHEKTLYIKGSPEQILELSDVSASAHRDAESHLHALASHGYRVIAFATLKAAAAPKDLSQLKNGQANFAGFLAFADELRPEAKGAIAAAQAAGIQVKLITGDHFETAFNIGKQLGLSQHHDHIITGSDLPKDMTALAEVASQKSVFARILPEDKFRILQALQTKEIVAMTGDGVNDVPALSRANVGIAMGSGSDIAKDAGGIVLLDNNFASIISALSEGRKIFDNIRRMLFYLLATSTGEIITMIGALAFNLPLPVTAIQILWINLATDTALVLPLGMEGAEEGHMKRPPRRPREPLLSKLLLSRLAVVASTMAVTCLLFVNYFNNQGWEVSDIQTVTFMALIAAQWMNAFNARSERESLLTRLRKPNYGMYVGFVIAFGLQMLVMFGPLQSVLGVTEVPLNALVWCSVVMAFNVFAVVEIHKLIARRLIGHNAPEGLRA